jgi:hypothetical protein
MRRPAVRSAMKDSDRIGFCVPGPSGVHILADLSVGAAVIFLDLPPPPKIKVPHELPFCGVVAEPLGDWLRV